MLLFLISNVAGIGFVLLSAFVFGIAFKQLKISFNRAGMAGSGRQLRMRITAVMGIWLLVVIALSFNKVLVQEHWIILALVLLPLLLTGIIVFSPGTAAWLKHIPLSGLTYMQSLRVVVALLLWMLFLNNCLPVHLTFEGKNFDVLAGLTAPVVALTLTRNKIVMVLWNVFSLAILLNVLMLVLLSAPGSLRLFPAGPGTGLMLKFPYLLLPAFLIPFFIMVHLLSLRKLFGNGQDQHY
ncbi:MAG: hypothetical protein KatS3mg032_2379 [Cyclobacteriaceae bacterium]|nr:MAG: hypothetical protein KatS3mg032_2379 [Cyclobacteriaceae bacterium]